VLPPVRPKYEKTLWRQDGWLKSVVASKFGADCNLLVSPANTKLGCCEPVVVLAVLEAAEVPASDGDVLKSIQGTATCFPPLAKLEEPIPVLLVVALGLLAPPPETEITPNSIRPVAGFIMVSLIVPISVPAVLLTGAPVSWLPRTG